MRRMIQLLFVLGCAVVAFIAAQPSHDVPIQPFVHVKRELSMGKDELHKLIAVRSDGTRVERVVPGGNRFSGHEVRVLILPAERKQVVISDSIRAVSTFYLSPSAADARKRFHASEQCREKAGDQAEFLGEVTLHDVLTFHYGRDKKAGVFQHEEWYAPALGCYQLASTYREIGGKGEAGRFFETSTVSLKLGEPDASLFAVPLEYREMPPSQSERELIEFTRGTPFGSRPADANLNRRFDRMDKHYQESQALKP